jgi:hypothetical protein
MGRQTIGRTPFYRYSVSFTILNHHLIGNVLLQVMLRGIPSLINILKGIPTNHEGGSYITERRPYMSTHPFFCGSHRSWICRNVSSHPRFFNHPTGPLVVDCIQFLELLMFVSSFYTTGVVNKAGRAHSSGAPEITPGFLWNSRCLFFLVLCVTDLSFIFF